MLSDITNISAGPGCKAAWCKFKLTSSEAIEKQIDSGATPVMVRNDPISNCQFH